MDSGYQMHNYPRPKESLQIGPDQGIIPASIFPVHFPVRHFHVQPGNVNIIKAHIQTLNLNPTVAVKITDYLSAGSGLDLMYLNFDLKRVLPLPLLGPQTLTLEGETWGLGGNLGLRLKPAMISPVMASATWRANKTIVPVMLLLLDN